MNTDRIGSSIWPSGLAGIANPYPARRRGHVVLVAPLLGELEVGGLRLRPGAHGLHPMPAADDGLPTLYRFTDAADPARVVFVTQ